MRRKIVLPTLIGSVLLPGVALAGGPAASLEAQIKELDRQLRELRSQVEQINQGQQEQQKQITALDDDLTEDIVNRFHWSGDFRARFDHFSRDRYINAHTTVEEKNDSLLSNRLRLNMYARVQDNVEFVGRLAMHKAWGMQNAPGGDPFFSGFPAFDGNSGRRLADNRLLVDRAFVNWNNIADSNFWFSIGRRPTTDGPPSQLRMNVEKRMATPVSYMDWPFDGLTIGYAYDKLFGADIPGRVRFCYGRGFEAGLERWGVAGNLEDTDFMGISWDIYDRDDRLVYLQSYMAMDVFNYPDLADPAAVALLGGMLGPRRNIGDIIHSSALYMDKWKNLNYFVAAGWSRTKPNRHGMLNDPGGAPNTNSEDGYSIYLGARYDIPQTPFKVGLEYNYGSRNWIGMSPGHDDIYASKLATRGHVYELYTTYDIPGRTGSLLGNASFRLGFQHYRYNYTGSLDWNIRPYDVGSVADRGAATAMGMAVVDKANQVYLTFDARF